ncbi:alpha-amylase family glycosyl hydrolase [Raineyella sp.]|uniref:alpha-amylase family glycosyl hydrolase n=1 Tax=Raineyella sp. TaxID=1911550 RepID=UPI002B1F29B6|nr:alpha-amylase family glycosyl hydrolase [Raineyella sp.]MEA5154990.1 alpha-amylase family glycosyl hydrolase [Raineyella sp.]
MSLLDTAVWWHVYPLGALGAPIRGERPAEVVHRLSGLEAWLDHVVDLGCSGLLLGPVFASDTHGYDTLDHFALDPRLGDDADFDHLLAAAAERGLAVVLDGVFNHVGRRHPWVERALAEGPQSECAGLVRIDWSDDGQGHRRGVPATWEGHGDLVPLRHDDPRVADAVVAIMLHWLRRGIAGWRLDVAYSVPSWFWRTVLARVRAEFPEMIVIGEVIHGDYPAIAAAGTLDSVTGYELWKATWSSLRDRNLWELAWALERHDRFSRDVVLQTFVGNHDVDRIADTVGDAGAALALAVLMTTPGMPSIYYGDEEAFRGRKGTGPAADDPVRPPLPAGPDRLAPYGAWMYRLHQDLIGLRRRHPWLVRARLRVVGKDCTWITYESTGPAGQTVRVGITLDPHPAVRIRTDSEELTWSGAPLDMAVR